MSSPLVLTAAAALFDMDGTLVDSTGVVEDLWLRFCRDHSVDSDELIPFSHGRPTRDTVSRFLPDADAAQVEAIVEDLEERELETMVGIVAIPGAGPLLADLALPWAVVTSAPRELAVRRMAAAGLPLPDVLVCADDDVASKPSPAGFLRAAAALGVDIGDCVVLEDSPTGIRAALASGAQVVVVGGHEANGADRVPDLRTLVLRHR